MHLLGLYLEDRAYGGPEEGGWYYDCGTLTCDDSLLKEAGIKPSDLKGYAKFGNAVKAARRLNDKIAATINVGRRSINSVLSEGRYCIQIFENGLPPYYPNVRPHYE